MLILLKKNGQQHCQKHCPDKGSSIVIWDRVNYLKEANKQLSDKNESQGNHS